ncbi:MAG TPA: alcohol dehydrogenase catalytic domain-containing protein [Burkholderiales bacterium]|jgi:propanol-preferring alcohol dehydrogenase|nr:alcohol dehydrogenase catalytic domain-containing protein [Burkholderiales bacterium]
MKAMVLKAANTPLVLESVPDPVPGPGEAVARVHACGAGLTIHHARAGRVPLKYPRILGHEITGEIVARGSGVTDLEVGDPVTAYFYLTCGHCRWCRINRETLCENFAGYVGRESDGGYAEYIKLPARSFLKLPAGLDWRRHAAEVGVICDAIATPVKVIRKARLMPSDTVAVFGAGGGLGVHMLMIARWARARKVIAIDVMASKFETCLKCGADATVDASQGNVAQQLLDITHGEGIDVAIDFVSSAESVQAAFAALGRGGRLVTLGGHGESFRAEPGAMLRKEIEIMGSRYATRQEVLDSLDLVARGDVWPLVTEKVPLEQAEAIHQRLEHGLITGRAALVVR